MSCSCEKNEVSKKILEMMKESGAHLQGHFKLTSGLHSDNYMQCALMLRYPKFAAYAGEELAKLLAPAKPDFILSPALGGLIIGHEVARALGVPFIFTERVDGEMRLKRFPHPGKLRFAMVEDHRVKRRRYWPQTARNGSPPAASSTAVRPTACRTGISSLSSKSVSPPTRRRSARSAKRGFLL